MIDVLLLTFGSLVWLIIMFAPLERAFPARRGQRFFRRAFWTDLLFFLGQYFVFGLIAVTTLTWVTGLFSEVSFLAPARQTFGALPLAAQVVIVVLGGDFLMYWGHRLQHHNDFLWRFHSIHHTSEEIDWLAAHREHPLDGVYTQLWMNLPAILLGMQVGEVMGVIAFRSLWAIFIHSNVSLPVGPLKYLFGSPRLHHWHHAKERDVGNYANLAPWLDVLFGTFFWRDVEPDELGIHEELPRGYLGLLLAPFKRRFTQS